MTRDLTDKTCILSAIFIYKHTSAIKVRLAENSKPQDDFWLPFSQITTIITYDGEETDLLNLDPHTNYLFRISGWIACKLFDCDGWDELVETDLSFLDCD